MMSNVCEMKEVNVNELDHEAMDQASGGSIFNRESSTRGVGISLWKYYGLIPGEFGTFYNTGEYCFKGQHVNQ